MSDKSGFFDLRVSITGMATVGTLIYGIVFWGGELHEKVDTNNAALLEVVRSMREHGSLQAHPHQAARSDAIERSIQRLDTRLGRVEDRLLRVLDQPRQ